MSRHVEASRLVPAPVALAIWRRRARRGWERPEVRERARRAVRASAPPGADVDALARRHLEESHVRSGIAFRPWQQAGSWLDRAPLDAAVAAGRGVLASYCHLGPIPGLTESLTAAHPAPCAVVGGWMFDQVDEIGHRRRLRMEAAGVTPIRADGGRDEIAAALRAGRVVSMAFDVPGSEPTRFLDRTLRLASGTARLAVDTGALVVPVARHRRRWRTFSSASAALDPRDFPSYRELHVALADLHTRAIRARPAEIEDPHRPGWWGSQIGAAPAGDELRVGL